MTPEDAERLRTLVGQLRALAAASSRTKSRDALQTDLGKIADRLAEYVVD